MSYSVTGIQASTVSYTFPATEHASGGSIHPPLTQTTVDTNKVQATDTTKVSTPDKFKVASTPHTAAPVDTVTLSTLDKVRNLRQQGEGDTLIATTLNLPLKEVDSDLHVSTQAPHLSFTVAPVTSPLSTNTVAETTVSATA